MEKFHTDEIVLPDRSNEINLDKSLAIKFTKMEPVEISINAEYFRPKFKEIFHSKLYTLLDHDSIINIIDNLIECLKNPEGK